MLLAASSSTTPLQEPVPQPPSTATVPRREAMPQLSPTATSFVTRASSRTCDDIVSLMLETSTGHPNVLLSYACERSLPWMAKKLVAAGARDDDGHILCRACARGDAEIVSILSPAASDAMAARALAAAAELGSAECVRLLCEAGTPVNTIDDEGRTPLFWACRSSSPACVGVLLHASADAINVRHRHSACTPLHVAALNGDPASVKLLLDAGADRSALDKDGRTPLDILRAPLLLYGKRGAGDKACERLLRDPPPRGSSRRKLFGVLQRGLRARPVNQ